MKLRLRGNSIRLRLEQHEIGRLVNDGRVVESVSFGKEAVFSYSVSLHQGKDFKAGFHGGEVKIEVPLEEAKAWAETETVGLYASLNEHSDFELKLSIEKDFQCLHKRPEEDESDLFPNPKAAS